MRNTRNDFSWTVALFVLLSCALAMAQQRTAAADEWQPVATIIGKTGSLQPGGVYKIGLPRKDLQVTVEGTPIKAGLALGSWIAFKKVGSGSMVMGDVVLTEDEVEPVMLRLEQGGMEVTALHNHVLHETPRVMYMHVSGHGDAVKLATTLHEALSISKTPLTDNAGATPPPAIARDFPAAQVDAALGYRGKDNGGIYQVSVPRAETIRDEGMEIPPSMGTATAINFQPTGNSRAAITGDFVLLAKEVNPVIRALRESGIAVTAVHSHMLTEEPRLFFLHFWANDDAIKLAKGLRTAIDRTNAAKP